MKYFWAFVLAALAWAWFLPGGPIGRQAEGVDAAQDAAVGQDAPLRADVAPTGPKLTPEMVRDWTEQALDWTDDEVAPDPMVLCGLDEGGEAYLRRSDCDAQGTPRTEPSWALLD